MYDWDRIGFFLSIYRTEVRNAQSKHTQYLHRRHGTSHFSNPAQEFSEPTDVSLYKTNPTLHVASFVASAMISNLIEILSKAPSNPTHHPTKSPLANALGFLSPNDEVRERNNDTSTNTQHAESCAHSPRKPMRHWRSRRIDARGNVPTTRPPYTATAFSPFVHRAGQPGRGLKSIIAGIAGLTILLSSLWCLHLIDEAANGTSKINPWRFHTGQPSQNPSHHNKTLVYITTHLSKVYSLYAEDAGHR